jgi:hypothetical protein
VKKCIVLSVLFWVSVAMGGEPSKLWGVGGELWEAGGRLPDFSYAGYRRGEAPLPERPVNLRASDFGVVGDGVADDTAALQRALNAAGAGGGKVLSLGPGRYRISDWLTIQASGVVLRGAGSGETVLVMDTPLNDIHPNWGSTTSGLPTSNYSWSGGYLRVTGKSPSDELAQVVGVSKRGERAEWWC